MYSNEIKKEKKLSSFDMNTSYIMHSSFRKSSKFVSSKKKDKRNLRLESVLLCSSHKYLLWNQKTNYTYVKYSKCQNGCIFVLIQTAKKNNNSTIIIKEELITV